MALISRSGLHAILQKNVVELGFIRRHAKAGYPFFRRMLCTLDKNFLNSIEGRIVFNFSNPINVPAYDTKAYNLLCVYDLLWQKFRNIPLETTNIIRAIPSHTKEFQEDFWRLFEAQFRKMSPHDKEQFMKH